MVGWGTLIVLSNSLRYSLYRSQRKFDYLAQFHEEQEATCLEFKFNWSVFFFFFNMCSVLELLSGEDFCEKVLSDHQMCFLESWRCNKVLQIGLCAEGGNIRFRWTSFHWLLCYLLTQSRKHSSDASRTHKITFNSAFCCVFPFKRT